MQKLNALLKNRQGAVFVMMACMTIVIFVFFMFVLETIKIYTIKFDVETNIRRLCNNVVENNIDKKYRMDGLNYLNTEDARQAFIDQFNDYTATVRQESGWGFVHSGSCYGSRFASKAGNGQFLWMVDITSMNFYRGDGEGGYNEPLAIAVGNIKIANSIPGLLHTFVFDIPIEMRSTNFRLDGESDFKIETGEGDAA